MKCEAYRFAPRWEECVRNLAHWPPILMRLKPEKPNYNIDKNKKKTRSLLCHPIQLLDI